MNQKLGWSVTDYAAPELASLFDSRQMFHWRIAATTNEPARANWTAAAIHTTSTTASAGLIISAAASSAVFEPSDPS